MTVAGSSEEQRSIKGEVSKFLHKKKRFSLMQGDSTHGTYDLSRNSLLYQGIRDASEAKEGLPKFGKTVKKIKEEMEDIKK